MKIKLLILIVSFFFLNSAEQTVHLKPYFGSKNVLSHITDFKIDKNTGKVKGFHHYIPASVEKTKDSLTISKIDSNLWIVTDSDCNDYHEGYIIHNGQWIDQKSFFPCAWTKEQLKATLSSIVLEPQKKLAHKLDYEIEHILENQCLKIVVTNFSDINKSFIKTIHPIVLSKKIDEVDLKEIAQQQEKELKKAKLEAPVNISNVPDIKPSEIEDNISKNTDIDYFYYKILSAENDQIFTVAKEILLQAIGHYKSDIFDIALPYVKITPEEILLRLVAKPRDDKLAQERANMIKFTLLHNPDLEISDDILIKALKAQSKEILEPLIRNYAYWNKLNLISKKAKEDPIANKIIIDFEKQSNKDPLLNAVYFGNSKIVANSISNITDIKLAKAHELAIERQNGTEDITRTEIAKRQEKKQAEKDIEKAKKKAEKDIEKKEFIEFCTWFAKVVGEENPLVKFTEEQLVLIEKYKNKELTSKGTTPILSCISKGKLLLVGQLLTLDVEIYCKTYGDQKQIITNDVIDFALTKIIEQPDNENYQKIMKLLCKSSKINVVNIIQNWITTETGFKNCLIFLEKYPQYFWPWFDLVIKDKKHFTLERFKALASFKDDLLRTVDKDNKNILILAAQANQIEIVKYLLMLKTPYIYEYNKKTISVFDHITKDNQTFELLDKLEIERQNKIQAKNLQLKKEQLEKEAVAKQKQADETAQKMGWTALIRAIHEENKNNIIQELQTVVDLHELYKAEKLALANNKPAIVKTIKTKKNDLLKKQFNELKFTKKIVSDIDIPIDYLFELAELYDSNDLKFSYLAAYNIQDFIQEETVVADLEMAISIYKQIIHNGSEDQIIRAKLKLVECYADLNNKEKAKELLMDTIEAGDLYEEISLETKIILIYLTNIEDHKTDLISYLRVLLTNPICSLQQQMNIKFALAHVIEKSRFTESPITEDEQKKLINDAKALFKEVRENSIIPSQKIQANYEFNRFYDDLLKIDYEIFLNEINAPHQKAIVTMALIAKLHTAKEYKKLQLYRKQMLKSSYVSNIKKAIIIYEIAVDYLHLKNNKYAIKYFEKYLETKEKTHEIPAKHLLCELYIIEPDANILKKTFEFCQDISASYFKCFDITPTIKSILTSKLLTQDEINTICVQILENPNFSDEIKEFADQIYKESPIKESDEVTEKKYIEIKELCESAAKDNSSEEAINFLEKALEIESDSSKIQELQLSAAESLVKLYFIKKVNYYRISELCSLILNSQHRTDQQKQFTKFYAGEIMKPSTELTLENLQPHFDFYETVLNNLVTPASTIPVIIILLKNLLNEDLADNNIIANIYYLLSHKNTALEKEIAKKYLDKFKEMQCTDPKIIKKQQLVLNIEKNSRLGLAHSYSEPGHSIQDHEKAINLCMEILSNENSTELDIESAENIIINILQEATNRALLDPSEDNEKTIFDHFNTIEQIEKLKNGERVNKTDRLILHLIKILEKVVIIYSHSECKVFFFSFLAKLYIQLNLLDSAKECYELVMKVKTNENGILIAKQSAQRMLDKFKEK
ncbi:MAG: hypothetical protein P4L22_03105 [Candidatus Babeliales bacterium]|nr:hypothetical protein [Candidatus Babeliales bacterium]